MHQNKWVRVHTFYSLDIHTLILGTLRDDWEFSSDNFSKCFLLENILK
jgi:hypothetical protein